MPTNDAIFFFCAGFGCAFAALALYANLSNYKASLRNAGWEEGRMYAEARHTPKRTANGQFAGKKK